MKKFLSLLLASIILANNAFSKGSDQAYIMPHTGNIPGWGQVDLSKSAAVKNQLTVPNGGTGVATMATGSILIGAGTSPVNPLAIGSNNTVLYSNGTTPGYSAVTQAMRAALPYAISSSATQTVSSGSETAVTNLTVTLVTTGRPVQMSLIADGSGSPCQTSTPYGGSSGDIWFLRDASNIARYETSAGTNWGSFNVAIESPGSAFSFIDAAASAASHTFSVSFSAGGVNFSISNCKLIAYEL